MQLSADELVAYRVALAQQLGVLVDQYNAIRAEYPVGPVFGEALDRLSPIDDAIETVRGLIEAANPGAIWEAQQRAEGQLPWQQTQAQFVEAYRPEVRLMPRNPERAIERALRRSRRAGHLVEGGEGVVHSQDEAGRKLILRCRQRRERYGLLLRVRQQEELDRQNADVDSKRSHYEFVEEALKAGEPVTEEVLRDYPVLRRTAC